MTEQPARQTILFIDDDEDLAQALGRILQANGYEVLHASNGDTGLAMARQEAPDLILMDYMMPVKDGFEACCELRADPKLSGVPVLAITAFGQNIGHLYGDADADSPSAAQDYLEKPVEPNILLDRVTRLLQGGTGQTFSRTAGES
jgi:DNA-binding response OmpR family regulator